ncbi:Transmembrane protein 203 like protein [Argiope bruennichi]|uniref:Transmembrane protein 203 like protein n=1 Tax=Argiope bruennichi TaxID=94029 RepID=A0A8T0FDC7_ARGBR|nr:Transmembrane protein 203 like protein [Argiope bruennichi]
MDMIFSLKELVKWLGLTILEILLNLIAVTIFSVMATLKLENYIRMSWWSTFVPLFICDGLNAYFCVIVFIRQYLEGMYKAAALRSSWSFIQLLLVFLFKLLLCLKLEGQKNLVYSEVVSPLFILLMLIMIRACQLN